MTSSTIKSRNRRWCSARSLRPLVCFTKTHTHKSMKHFLQSRAISLLIRTIVPRIMIIRCNRNQCKRFDYLPFFVCCSPATVLHFISPFEEQISAVGALFAEYRIFVGDGEGDYIYRKIYTRRERLSFIKLSSKYFENAFRSLALQSQFLFISRIFHNSSETDSPRSLQRKGLHSAN